MKRWFEGKSFVITGASSGLGYSLASAAAKQGARLLLAARRHDRLKDLAARLGSEVEAHTIGLDLTKPEQCETLIREAESRLGGVDVLVLNAGQADYKSVLDSGIEEARRLMEINYFAPLTSIKAALPQMLAHNGGHIVVVSSICGYIHLPMSAPYAASKAAVASLARVLSTEVTPPISVTVVYPGAIRTEMWDMVRTSVPVMQYLERTGMDADVAAKKVLKAIQKKKYTLYLTWPAVLMEAQMRMAPNTVDWITRKIFRKIPQRLLRPPAMEQ